MPEAAPPPITAATEPTTQTPEPPAPPATPVEKLYGGDTATGTDTASGAEMAPGADSVTGPASESGPDSVSGADSATASEGALAPDAFTLPEGVEPNTETLASYATLATEVGLSQEAAQRLLDFHYGEVAKLAQATETAWTETLTSWKSEIDKDPVLGGDKTAGVQVVIGRALDQYGSAEARQAFEVTGAGWNPAIIRFVHNMANALNEGGPISGSPPSARAPASPAERLYGQNP